MPIVPVPGFRRTDAIALFGALLFCLCLWFIRYPQPFGDDLFFCGAAINLAKGGDFTNPYITGFASIFPTHYFFLQLPLHSYVLGGWLRIFGIGSASLMEFQWFFALVAGTMLTLTLWRGFRVPVWVGIVGSAMLVVSLLRLGFRYEPLAFSLLLAGTAIFSSTSWWRGAAGFLLVGAACLTMPTAPGYALPLLCARLFLDWHEGTFSPGRDAARLALVAAGCVALVIFLFAGLIHFHLAEFWRTFTQHAALRRTPLRLVPGEIARQLTFGQEWLLVLPTYLLWAVSLGLAWRHRNRLPLPWVALTLALTVGLILNWVLYVAMAFRYAFGFGWVITLLILVLGQPTPRKRLVAGVLLAGLLVCSQLQIAAEFLLANHHSEANHAQVRAAVAALPAGKTLAVDAHAARFIFDYRLPAGTQAWEWLFPYHSPQSFQERAPDSVWVIQTDGGLATRHDPALIFGRPSKTIVRQPDDITLIP